ncbi:MAG TPA: NAD(P)(+) transhydrogenase (Re/Si-specific) subunit beta [bacterium]|jgi:NAD(P) transhydrogenase subunit beta
MSPQVIDLFYIAASVLFIVGLKMLSKASTARKGNQISLGGMLLAMIVTILLPEVREYQWIILGVIIGTGIGIISAKIVKMTQMPEMVGLFNGSGGLASLLVGAAEWMVIDYNYEAYAANHPNVGFTIGAIYFTELIGGVTFIGSIIAWAKLAEKIDGKPVLFAGQQIVNGVLLVAILICGIMFIAQPTSGYANIIFAIIVVLSLILGVLAVIPIGGADMPVVISLLNSYSGLAACAAGFVINNNVLIVAGALVGASGLILTNIMCKAMNRSLANVLFSGFGAVTESAAGAAVQGEAKPISAEDTYYILEAAKSVIFVPGYGMAVAQAQHVVKELGDLLTENGAEVRYVVHPVAGRMPGHMNVLLAEANVEYDQLVEPPDVNPAMETVDVAIVIGANDVVNPAAKTDETSPIWGMPIVEVDRARTCIVLKRSLNPGFAGIQNPLFFYPNTRMLLGDAKASVSNLVAQFKDG